MLTIFLMFATRTEASKLNLLKGSPHRWLHRPILDYIEARGARLHLRHRVLELCASEGASADGRSGPDALAPQLRDGV